MRNREAILFVAGLGGASLLLAAQHKSTSPPQGGFAQAVCPQLAGILPGKTRVVDMTYAINSKLPVWPGDDHTFEAQVVATPEKDGDFAGSFWMLEHYGTRMDAPAHFPPGKLTLDQIPVDHFFGPAVLIDVREEAGKDSDYRLMPADVEKWKTIHGRVSSGSVVLLRTGWASHWPDQSRYRNMDGNGAMHFPGFSAESARLLVARGVVGLGIDTASVDYGPSKDFEAHQVSLPAGLYNLENLANLD